MKVNNEMNINVLPFILLIFIRVLNSLFNIEVILIHIKFIRDGINQNIDGINISPKIDLIQFNDKFDLEDGSKIENKLVIIFNFLKFCCLFFLFCWFCI